MSDFLVSEITDKDKWEGLNRNCSNKTFMQSWSSKEWRQSLGQKVWLFGILDNDELIAGVLVTKMPIIQKYGLEKFFLFIPHGPLIHKNYWPIRKKLLGAFLSYLKEFFKDDTSISFLRVAPPWLREKENLKIFRDNAFRNAPMFIVPEVTWCLDISPSDEELLRGMRKTTRYLIRQGLKNQNLKIEKGCDQKDLDFFLSLYEKTVNRHDFQAFSLDYLKKELECLRRNDEILIFNAYYQKQPIASAMIIFYQGVAYYHQGASVNHQPKGAPGSYLIQWKAIQEAKARGCSLYNFWGIADQEEKLDHAYRGLTLFKKGFGGFRREYVFNQDLIWEMSYWPNYLIEKLRRRKRNL